MKNLVETEFIGERVGHTTVALLTESFSLEFSPDQKKLRAFLALDVTLYKERNPL